MSQYREINWENMDEGQDINFEMSEYQHPNNRRLDQTADSITQIYVIEELMRQFMQYCKDKIESAMYIKDIKKLTQLRKKLINKREQIVQYLKEQTEEYDAIMKVFQLGHVTEIRLSFLILNISQEQNREKQIQKERKIKKLQEEKYRKNFVKKEIQSEREFNEKEKEKIKN